MISLLRSNVLALTAIVLAAFGLVCPAPAAPGNSASGGSPLNATPQEIVRLYGPVLRHNARVRRHQILEGGSVLDGDLHGKNGLVIRVVYHQDRAVLLEFNRAGGTLTPGDITALLASCADNSSWETGKDSTDTEKYYHRLDHHAVAQWSAAADSLLVSAEGDTPADDLSSRLLQ